MSLKNIIAKVATVATVFVSINTQAQQLNSSLIKTFDGAVAYCPKSGFENPLAHEKNVRIETIQEGNSSVVLRVSLLKCEAGQWKMDVTPNSEKYSVNLGQNAVSVEKSYTNYQLLVLSQDSELVAIKDLQNLESQSVEAVSFNLDQAKQNKYEVVLRVKNSMKASNGVVDEAHYETFGSYNLILK